MGLSVLQLLFGFLFLVTEFLPVLWDATLFFVILSSGGTFFFWHMSFDKVSFLDVFRGAFGADDVAASREDCLFMVFGGIMCSSFYISVI